jgi:hypothetical protein
MTGNETDLRERFAQLRAEERMGVPLFAARHQLQKRRIAWPMIAAPATLILIIVLFLTLTTRTRPANFSDSDRVAVRSVAAWHPPTDFLLHTPGSELLTTTPRIPDLKGIPR